MKTKKSQVQQELIKLQNRIIKLACAEIDAPDMMDADLFNASAVVKLYYQISGIKLYISAADNTRLLNTISQKVKALEEEAND